MYLSIIFKFDRTIGIFLMTVDTCYFSGNIGYDEFAFLTFSFS